MRIHEFLLNLKSDNIEKLDELFTGLIACKEFNADLMLHKVFKKEKHAVYRIRITAASLIAFKKRFDAECCFESFELFEYKDW